MKTTMPQVSAFFSLLLLLFTTSCDDEREVQLSEDGEAREDVYEQILNDEDLFTEFMEELRESETAMQWMDNDRPMMNRFYGKERMHTMMKRNPQMRDSMMMGMMNSMHGDTTMRPTPQMRERMLQHMELMIQRDTAFAREMRQMVMENTK